ncbi:MAG: threonine synthase [Burkholderiales bacterium]|jgi:threonine synthase|nr:threonine synthase [Burkholderiales bacterium]
MRYISTRGGDAGEVKTFCSALLEGLARDGGLFVPDHYPIIGEKELAEWRFLDYPDLCLEIVARYANDIEHNELKTLIDRTYTTQAFGSSEITSTRSLGAELFLLRVANGPTLAFKDIAMQLLGNLFEFVLVREDRVLNILGATSGDTGSSAEYAMRGKHRVKVFMLSPYRRMSPFQQAQMYSLAEANIFNLAIEGTFDSCQDIVKTIGNDHLFKTQYHLGAVNSINWARVLAQAVYYFKGYFAATAGNGDEIDVAVPTGNFGNILAAYIAKRMGLPLRRLILATNENDVLDEFFRTGRYRPRSVQETRATSSPSMDISKASNFERFIFDCADRDHNKVRQLWQTLAQYGGFDLTEPEYQEVWNRVAQSGFVSGSSTHADRLATIRKVYAQYGEIVDPHTADGIKVGLEYKEEGVPLICVETALPAKFAQTIKEALDIMPPRPSAYEHLESLPQHFDVLPADAEEVKLFMKRHL